MTYNHHPAVHGLMPNASEQKKLPPDQYCKARFANTLEWPTIEQWVGSFMVELSVVYGAATLYHSNTYWNRSEHGPNGNPHFHREIWSKYYSKKFNGWLDNLKKDYRDLKANCDISTGLDKKDLTDKQETFEQQVRVLHNNCGDKYMRQMSYLYTNWNPGLTKDGKRKTFDFTFDRKTTVVNADVERLIDDACRSANF